MVPFSPGLYTAEGALCSRGRLRRMRRIPGPAGDGPHIGAQHMQKPIGEQVQQRKRLATGGDGCLSLDPGLSTYRAHRASGLHEKKDQ